MTLPSCCARSPRATDPFPPLHRPPWRRAPAASPLPPTVTPTARPRTDFSPHPPRPPKPTVVASRAACPPHVSCLAGIPHSWRTRAPRAPGPPACPRSPGPPRLHPPLPQALRLVTPSRVLSPAPAPLARWTALARRAAAVPPRRHSCLRRLGVGGGGGGGRGGVRGAPLLRGRRAPRLPPPPPPSRPHKQAPPHHSPHLYPRALIEAPPSHPILATMFVRPCPTRPPTPTLVHQPPALGPHTSTV